MLMRALAVLSILVALPTRPSHACTTFRLQGPEGPVIGKSYDWDTAPGHLVWNPAGARKRAFLPGLLDTPYEWTARYGSATFVQYGRELPNGGMNTEGLVVEVMWLNEAEAMAVDRRPAVSELQWIQLQLDRHATVREVVAAADEVRIARIYARVHYLVCDATGECAALEPLGGRLVVTHGDALTFPVLANEPYADGLASAQQCAGLGGKEAIGRTARTGHRFARAAKRTVTPGTPADAFVQLEDVAQGGFTKWQIVYQPKTREIAWRTSNARAIKRSGPLSALPAACATGARYVDLDVEAAGPVTWVPWTAEANTRLLTGNYEELATSTQERRLLGVLAAAAAGYPVGIRCQSP
ncbi:MAG: linear amide C-N hydrolase [Myxococcales bacterium]|nr:linear amide C-N hydrolase [Myxococcales bacterium]